MTTRAQFEICHVKYHRRRILFKILSGNIGSKYDRLTPLGADPEECTAEDETVAIKQTAFGLHQRGSDYSSRRHRGRSVTKNPLRSDCGGGSRQCVN